MAQKFQGFDRHWFRSGNRANPNFRVIWMRLWAVNDLRGKEQCNLVQFALAYDDAVGEYLSAITQHGYISELVHETAVLIVDYRLIDTIANSFTAFTDGDSFMTILKHAQYSALLAFSLCVYTFATACIHMFSRQNG